MIYRKGDTERSPEGRTDGQEGINSPINPDTGQKKEQSLPMSGGDGDREEQFASMSGRAGDREEQSLSMSGGAGEKEEQSLPMSGEMGGSAEQSPADAPLVNEGKDASGEGKGKKGEGNLILRLLNSEGMRYLFIGGCTTMVNLVVYAVLCRVVHLNVNISNIISVSVSILFAYITNKLIVFRSHCSSLSELAAECARFIGARLATMVIEVGGVFVLYEILHQNEMVAKLATQVLVVIGNYFISRFLVFKDRNK